MKTLVADKLATDSAMSHVLFEKLSSHHLILTVNSRLTRYLQTAWDEYHLDQKKKTWETLTVLPLSSWLEHTFHLNNKTDLILLNAFQENCVWENIVTQSPLAPDIIHPTQLAVRVKEAWELLNYWQIPLDTLNAYSAQREVACLIEWINQFKKIAHEKNWITTAEIPNKLLAESININKKIILMGFDDLNPSLKKLFTHLAKQTAVETETLSIQSQAEQVVLEDTESELITMAQWIKTEWKKNPTAKLGCVVPELEKIRPQVARIFTHIFCIENIIPNADAKKPPFNISAGTPFSCNKLIHTGLSLLQLCITPLPIQQLAALLQSPYLCPTEEDACIGAQLDALLREKNQLQVGLLDLYNTIPLLSSRYKNNTHLLRWRTLLQFSREKKAIPLKPSMWAHEFIHLLKSMQWPGERTQTTEEFQALEKFKKILFEFSKLDFIFDEIKLAKAFQLLQSQVQQTIFQAKSHDEPIQIMGTLEASSILFDAVWIMGLHDAIWPAATQPHPLIPYAIQQQYQMPHATAERELQFCERMTKRLMQSAKQVIFSSPAKTGDQLLFPSRLIQSVPFTSSDAFINKNENTLAEQILAKKQLETVSDDNTIPIHDFSMIRGGSHILKLQALCPYQAFAKIRLQAKPLNEPTLGIAAMIKGVIIHQVLFEIWDNIKDQMTLKKMDQNALNKLIVDKIDKAITENIAPSNAKHQHALIAVEKKRLQLLIQDWLKIEKSRPDFRVHSLETACQISINALPLKLRLDRVDELADGSLLLIDYKSGKNEIKNLLQERLTDPQLPLYAAYQNKNEPAYQGVAFAEIRNAKMSYQGITHENRKEQKTNTFQLIPIQDTKNDLRITQWETAIESWKKSLEATADDFCRGKITIDPIQKVTCDHCGLQSVCRYNIAESITEKQ